VDTLIAMPDITSRYTDPEIAYIDQRRGGKTREQYQHDVLTTGFVPPVPETWRNHLGLCADYSSSTVALAVALNVEWVRTSPEYGWNVGAAQVRAQTDALRAAGLKHLVVVQYAGHNYDAVINDATVRSAFISWIASLAPVVDGIEVLNEPNLTSVFWKGTYDSSWRTQARLMFEVAVACKRANPAVKMVTAGMSPYGNDDGGRVVKWPQSALPLLLAEIDRLAIAAGFSGIAALFDGIGQHLYEAKYDPRSGPDANHPGWWAVKRNRTVWSGGSASGTSGSWTWTGIAKYGIPIWNTEYGQKRADFTSDAAAAAHMTNYFAEYEAQRAAGIRFGPHIVISKNAFDGDWTLDAATRNVITAQSKKAW